MLTAAESTHQTLLEKWRHAMDLVGPGPIEGHFVDAARAVDALGACRGRWADLGSGAGFPGVALAARNPETQVLLVESRRKRTTFLETVVFEAGLANAAVWCGRTEKLTDRFDGLISRAYKAPEGVLADAEGLLAGGGRVALMLGDREWAPPDGWVVVGGARYAVVDGHRRVVVVSRG